jgi:integrase
VRVGAELADALKPLDEATWQAIQRTSDFAIGPRVFEAMERLRLAERAELRNAVRHFGPDMKIRDVVLVSKLDWRVIAGAWGTSNADWNHMRRSLSAVLTTLFHDDTAHPVRREVIAAIPLLHEKEHVPDLPPALVWRILEQLPDHARAFPMVLVVTGLRIGEYERLEPHHLQHESFRIDVPGTKTDASDDYVQVAPDMWPVVVRGVPSPYRYGWMRRIFREACEKAGVQGVTLHDLRHCHGQWAMENGAEEHEVQAQLRHRSIGMTRRYVKTVKRQRVAEAAAGHFMAAKLD